MKVSHLGTTQGSFQQMAAHAVCFDSVGPQWGFHLDLFVCLFYKTFPIVISLSRTIIQIGEKSPLWWSPASCQGAGLGERNMGWISASLPCNQVSCAVNSLNSCAWYLAPR